MHAAKVTVEKLKVLEQYTGTLGNKVL